MCDTWPMRHMSPTTPKLWSPCKCVMKILSIVEGLHQLFCIWIWVPSPASKIHIELPAPRYIMDTYHQYTSSIYIRYIMDTWYTYPWYIYISYPHLDISWICISCIHDISSKHIVYIYCLYHQSSTSKTVPFYISSTYHEYIWSMAFNVRAMSNYSLLTWISHMDIYYSWCASILGVRLFHVNISILLLLLIQHSYVRLFGIYTTTIFVTRFSIWVSHIENLYVRLLAVYMYMSRRSHMDIYCIYPYEVIRIYTVYE